MFNVNDVWNHFKNAPDPVSKLRAVGDILQYAIPFSALFAVAITQMPLGWTWVKVVAVTALTVQLMKHAFNKTWLGVRPDGHEMSFPSGHTSGAFSGAWFYLFAFGWQVALIPLLLAALTATSRVLAKKHHVRDVVVGALVALGYTLYFFN